MKWWDKLRSSIMKRLPGWLQKLLGEDKEEKKENEAFPESVPNNGADVSSWPQTCTIGKIIWQSPGITWTYSDEGDRDAWPEFSGDLNGHLCALVKGSDGKWHQCFLDSLRRKGKNGWNSQTLSPFRTHGNLISGPLKNWSAKKGEKLGIYVVSDGWVYGGRTHKRSNVVWTE